MSETFAMRPRHRSMLFAVAAVLSTLTPRFAPAAERSCSTIKVRADSGVRARFPDMLERIHGEFTGQPDVDTCARVELRLRDDDAIEVAVALPDGRASSRSVREPEDVIPTLQALLLVPVPAPASRAAPTQPSRPVTVAPRTLSRVDEPEDSNRNAPTNATREFGVELSALTGARAGDGQFAYGAGGLSLLEVNGWLLGFEGRVDAYQSLGGSDPESALELAVLAGRRVYFGGVALDLTAGPAVAMKGIAPFSQTESDPVERMATTTPRPPPPEPSTGALPRLLVGARLGFSPRSVFRTFVGFEGEFGPSRADDAAPYDPPSPWMPRYTAGLILGATVGTQ